MLTLLDELHQALEVFWIRVGAYLRDLTLHVLKLLY